MTRLRLKRVLKKWFLLCMYCRSDRKINKLYKKRCEIDPK